MIRRFVQGQHICALYDTEAEQIAIAAEHLSDGLRAGERCLYVSHSAGALASFDVALRACGIDVDDVVASGALHRRTHAQAHLDGGRFDAERMMGLLNEAVDAALRDGFAGLRTCGDMSWLIGDPPGADQVVAYEAFLNGFFEGLPACGMCQYDRTRLPAELIDHGLATHSSVLHDGRLIVSPARSS